MESRAFGTGRNRTFYKGIGMSRTDAITLAFAFLPCALGIVMRLSGYGNYQYYPTLGWVTLSSLEWSLLVLLVFLLSAILLLAYVKRRVDLD